MLKSRAKILEGRTKIITNNIFRKSLVTGIIIFLISTSQISAYNNKLISGEHINIDDVLQDRHKTIFANWTIMFYFACDNIRSKLNDNMLERLTDIGSNPDFNMIALVDGKLNPDTFYYYIEKDQLTPLEWYESESNMADPQNFEFFLNLTIHEFPANNYALFTLSSHGSGWQGVFCDYSTGNNRQLDIITLPEVSNVLKNVTENIGKKIDLWGIDVCVPAMIEVAYQISPYVNFMVANEEHGAEGFISEEGYLLDWNYSYFLEKLKNATEMEPEDFASLIVNCYRPGTFAYKLFDKFSPPEWYPMIKIYTTLSAVNLTKINETSNTKNIIRRFAENLTNNLKQCKHAIKAARLNTREYGKQYRRFWWLPHKIIWLWFEPLGYDCFIDLYNFAENLYYEVELLNIKDDCKMVMEAINNSVIANIALLNDPSYGLSIYFPELKCQYNQSIWRTIGIPSFKKIPTPYETIKFSQDTGWDIFIRKYLKI